MVPFVLETGVWVEASCGRAEECPHYRGRVYPRSGFEPLVPNSESWPSHRGVGEPVVSWRIWLPLVKFLELLHTAYRKVVKWFLRPVLTFQIVKPFDQV